MDDLTTDEALIGRMLKQQLSLQATIEQLKTRIAELEEENKNLKEKAGD